MIHDLTPPSHAAAAAALTRLRRMVLGLVAFGLIGTSVELALLAHFEDLNQYIPFIVAGVSLVALAWHLFSRRRASVRAVQIAMLLTIATGLTGVVLHYRANMEFQLESDPSLGGFALMTKVLEAKAPPALAPGNMALLGLLGLAALHRVDE